MSEQVTIVVVPRDRFSSVVMCAESILKNTDVPFRLTFLDFGYSQRTLKKLVHLCRDVPTQFVRCGRTIPMVAFREHLPEVATPYVAWVDNDTYVTPGWMSALLERAAQGARVVSPVTLEREGFDRASRKAPLRNHISHSELRRVSVDGVPYVFDYKPYRRATPDEIPQEPHTIDYFELHTFFAETDVLRRLELPEMVVREHIDIGIQLHRLGIDIWCEPNSVVHFDNMHERPSFRDLRFFFFRWAQRRINQSHDLFDERWGYRFLSEQSIKNWAFRRKVFGVCRFIRLPHGFSDLVARGLNKAFRPSIPVHFPRDPVPQSERVLVRPEVAAQA
jgi:hypothetical protein